MDKEKYWEEVTNKLNNLIFDFENRLNESIDPEYLVDIRLSEIKKLWSFSNFRIGFEGNKPIYDGGKFRYIYDDLISGNRDYDNINHLELDSYLLFEKYLNGDKKNIKTPKIRLDKQKIKIVREYKNTNSLKKALVDENLDDFFCILKSRFSSIPYTIHKRKVNEDFFHTLLHSFLISENINFSSEYTTNNGRIDILVNLENTIYIFELKLDFSSETALLQIKEKKYYNEFILQEKKICLIGISFDSKNRNVRDFKYEYFNK